MWAVSRLRIHFLLKREKWIKSRVKKKKKKWCRHRFFFRYLACVFVVSVATAVATVFSVFGKCQQSGSEEMEMRHTIWNCTCWTLQCTRTARHCAVCCVHPPNNQNVWINWNDQSIGRASAIKFKHKIIHSFIYCLFIYNFCCMECCALCFVLCRFSVPLGYAEVKVSLSLSCCCCVEHNFFYSFYKLLHVDVVYNICRQISQWRPHCTFLPNNKTVAWPHSWYACLGSGKSEAQNTTINLILSQCSVFECVCSIAMWTGLFFFRSPWHPKQYYNGNWHCPLFSAFDSNELHSNIPTWIFASQLSQVIPIRCNPISKLLDSIASPHALHFATHAHDSCVFQVTQHHCEYDSIANWIISTANSNKNDNNKKTKQKYYFVAFLFSNRTLVARHNIHIYTFPSAVVCILPPVCVIRSARSPNIMCSGILQWHMTFNTRTETLCISLDFPFLHPTKNPFEIWSRIVVDMIWRCAIARIVDPSICHLIIITTRCLPVPHGDAICDGGIDLLYNRCNWLALLCLHYKCFLIFSAIARR